LEKLSRINSQAKVNNSEKPQYNCNDLELELATTDCIRMRLEPLRAGRRRISSILSQR
jgi:hypothetical protein